MSDAMTFEFDGEKYKKASAHQKEWGRKLISEFHFKGSERILDLGSGDGTITAEIADHVPDGFILGIDASEGMIKTAKSANRKPNLKFELMDINAMDFTDEFDVVISNAALHWVKDHEMLLKNVHKALKENGRVRFNFAADGNCSNFFKVVREVMAAPAFKTFFRTFTWPWYMPGIEEYTALAERSPFSEVSVWGGNADRYFPDAGSMTKWIDQPSIVPFLDSIPSSKEAGLFRDAVVKKMVEETLQKDGTCFETFRRVNLRALKAPKE